MNAFTTLVSTETLSLHLDDPSWVILDVRFDLANPGAGRQMYEAAHIPNAHFLNLNHDIASAPSPSGGRHPLPDVETFCEKLRTCGVSPSSQIVVYDGGSAMLVARTWWMIRHWLGHAAVAVLDGGYAVWERERRVVSSATPAVSASQRGTFVPKENSTGVVSTDTLLRGLAQHAHLIIDARAPERFRGEIEPLDAAAGHIPGARNRPFLQNISPEGTFVPSAQMSAEFEALLGGRSPSEVVHSCGSGVSALANLLAMEHAGLHGSQLYPGSWSAWSADPSRPIATGA